jgi:hypothetical protein
MSKKRKKKKENGSKTGLNMVSNYQNHVALRYLSRQLIPGKGSGTPPKQEDHIHFFLIVCSWRRGTRLRLPPGLARKST